MKKIKYLSLLLCLTVLLQCIFVPAFATEIQDATETPTQTVETVDPATEPTEAPFGTVSIQSGCRTIEGQVPLAGSERKLETAQAAFLYEMNTGTVIYAYNPDMKLAPGSLVKIVTAIVVLENCELDEVVTVASGIKSRLPASTLDMDLTSEEEMSVNDLLHGLLLISANDAAVALAEYVAGTRQAFVTMINIWVKKIGCTNTEFGSVHGVDGGASHTTARDMAKIIQEAVKNETFKEIFGTTPQKYRVQNT